MKGSGVGFMNSLGTWLFEVGSLRSSVAVDGLVRMGCEVVAVALVDLTLKLFSVIFGIVDVYYDGGRNMLMCFRSFDE